MIGMRWPVSAALGALALGLSLAVAFPLGIAAAMTPGRGWDRLNAFVAAAGVSVPSFILGAVLLYLFSYRLGWFPSVGWRGLSSAVLPAVALAALPTAYLARLVRSELIEILRSEFLMTARAKGLSMPRVVVVHALRHVMSPVLAYLGPQAAAIMTGSFVVEAIFNVPGLGSQFVSSIANRNYPMIMGVTLFYTVILVSFNLLADVMAAWLDPRLRQR
jgi:oligopeptide transport system permease protein